MTQVRAHGGAFVLVLAVPDSREALDKAHQLESFLRSATPGRHSQEGPPDVTQIMVLSKHHVFLYICNPPCASASHLAHRHSLLKSFIPCTNDFLHKPLLLRPAACLLAILVPLLYGYRIAASACVSAVHELLRRAASHSHCIVSL